MFRRKHKHKFVYHQVYSGAAMVTQYGECACGEQTKRELTPAGYQQLGWWMELFPEWDRTAVTNGILYGLLPYPMTWDPEWRMLTRDELLSAVE